MPNKCTICKKHINYGLYYNVLVATHHRDYDKYRASFGQYEFDRLKKLNLLDDVVEAEHIVYIVCNKCASIEKDAIELAENLYSFLNQL